MKVVNFFIASIKSVFFLFVVALSASIGGFLAGFAYIEVKQPEAEGCGVMTGTITHYCVPSRELIMHDSLGGNVNAGLQIMSSVDTIIATGDYCYSMCAFMLISVKHRYVCKGTIVGFHPASYDDNGKRKRADLTTGFIRYYVSQNKKNDMAHFDKMMRETSPSETYDMTGKELLEHGMIDGVVECDYERLLSGVSRENYVEI